MENTLVYKCAHSESKLFVFDKSQLELAARPSISLVIPAYNEANRIRGTLLRWLNFLNLNYPDDYEVLVIMDGCIDKTADIVRGFSKHDCQIIPLIYGKRLGKGGALIEAFKHSTGKTLFFTDADGAIAPQEIAKFSKALETSDLAIGCRYYRGSTFVNNLPLKRLLLSRVFNASLKIFFPEMLNIVDTQCGAKALRTETIQQLPKEELFITDFAFDVNLIYSLRKKGFKVAEVYVHSEHVEDSSKVSKALFKTGLNMFFSIIRLRLYNSRFQRLLDKKPLSRIILLLMKASF